MRGIFIKIQEKNYMVYFKVLSRNFLNGWKQSMTIYSQKSLRLWTFKEGSFEISRLTNSSVRMLWRW